MYAHMVPMRPGTSWSRTCRGTHNRQLMHHAYGLVSVDNFDQPFNDYTYPVYYADATGNYTVNGGNGTINGKQMPWNPNMVGGWWFRCTSHRAGSGYRAGVELVAGQCFAEHDQCSQMAALLASGDTVQ